MNPRALLVTYIGIRPDAGWISVAATAVIFFGFFLLLGHGSLQEGALTWYSATAGPNAWLAEPVRTFVAGAGAPILTALLFGMLGATSPCQLSTNAAALAYVVQRGANPLEVGKTTAGYVLGKIVVYMLLGLFAIFLGREVASNMVPVIELVRKVLGPLMVVLALVLLGLLRPGWGLGFGMSAWLEKRAAQSAWPSGVILGMAFALAFCPTLFLLFFGLTIPLAVTSSYGLVFPIIFALGTSLPLIVLAALVAFGGAAQRGALLGLGAAGRWIRPVAALVLLLAGFNDTFVYWFL